MQKFELQQNGEAVSQDAIRVLEVRRGRHMMNLLLAKLGPAGMMKLFEVEIEEAYAREEAWVAASDGQFAYATLTAHVSEGSSAEFLAWFRGGYMSNNALAMERSHPEHLGKLLLEDGLLGLLEVMGQGEAPSLGHIHLMPEDAEMPIPLDPAFPHRTMGRGVCRNGKTFGGYAHQLRDVPSGGFEARLVCFFPAAMPHELVSGHEGHMLVEFSNWLQMYLETRQQPADLLPIALTVNT